jgi:ATP-grasp domain, R2K clade family 3
MSSIGAENLDIFLLENSVWIAASIIHVPRYDFSFETFFSCRRPYQRPEQITAIGRFGAIDNYKNLYDALQAEGISLIHTPEQHRLASELTSWYPLLKDITPHSLWFDAPPEASIIEKHFSYPVFIKGNRQTSRHNAHLSIIHSRAEYELAIMHYQNNPILHWQSFVCRDFVTLRSVPIRQRSEKIPPSFEFRTFWWRGEYVGIGAYWADFASYAWTEAEKFAALQVAQKAADRLEVVFLVIDVAQTAQGEWIVIECNDGQESGYAAVAPIALWQNIIDSEGREVNLEKLQKSQG